MLALLVGVALGLSLDNRSDRPRAQADYLHVTIYPQGLEQPAGRDFTVRCPASDTGETCRRLRSVSWSALFPQTADRVCPQLYGGPEVATLEGHFGGRDIRETVTRSDGCGTSTWQELEFLLGPVEPVCVELCPKPVEVVPVEPPVGQQDKSEHSAPPRTATDPPIDSPDTLKFKH